MVGGTLLVLGNLTLLSQPVGVRAVVTYYDGATVEVSGVGLEYTWVKKEDLKYLNPGYHERDANAFWISESSRGITVMKQLPLVEVLTLQVTYTPDQIKSDSFCSAKEVALAARDGRRFTVKQLVAAPDDAIVEGVPAVFASVDLKGTAFLNGQKGRFSAKLWGSGRCPGKDEAVRMVTFGP